MKLKRLSITNCSRIKDIEVDVRDHMVLVGPNGAGKTTLIRCLDMALGTSLEELRESFQKGLIRDTSRPFSVEAVFAGLSQDELSLFSDAHGASCDTELSVLLEATFDDGEAIVRRRFSCGQCGERLSEAHREAVGWALVQADSAMQGVSDGDEALKSAIDEVLSEIDQIDDEALRHLRERSDGVRALFAIATYDLLHQEANVLAIDEPEAHLHPTSQRTLARMLKAGRSQKIVATHSPSIIGSFDPDEIVSIRADGSAVQPRAGFLDGDIRLVARWWIGRQLEPLTASAVIAVEGPSDRIVVNKVARTLGYDLDRNDVVVVETDGCGDMKVVQTIFGPGGFRIPLFLLVDDDAREGTAKLVGADPEDVADMESRHMFVSVRDLEDEYVHAIGARRLWDEISSRQLFTRNVLSNCEVGEGGYPSEEALARFIREKSNRKIPCALTAANLIDDSNVNSVGSVVRLLKAVSSL